MTNKSAIISYFLIGVPIIISIYLTINSRMLIPSGYELGVDGYLVARTIIIVFSLYLVFKLGLLLLKKNS